MAASVPYGTDKRPVIANPGLKPEITTNFEIGMKKKLGTGTQLDMDFFKDKTKDYIGYPSQSVSPDVKYYYNMGKADTRGIELTFQRLFNPVWSAYATTHGRSAKSAENGTTTFPVICSMPVWPTAEIPGMSIWTACLYQPQ